MDHETGAIEEEQYVIYSVIKIFKLKIVIILYSKYFIKQGELDQMMNNWTVNLIKSDNKRYEEKYSGNKNTLHIDSMVYTNDKINTSLGEGVMFIKTNTNSKRAAV